MRDIALDFRVTQIYNRDMTMKRKRMGRPPKPKAEKQSARIGVRVTPEEFRAISQAAKAAGLSRGAFLVACWKERA